MYIYIYICIALYLSLYIYIYMLNAMRASGTVPSWPSML